MKGSDRDAGTGLNAAGHLLQGCRADKRVICKHDQRNAVFAGKHVARRRDRVTRATLLLLDHKRRTVQP